MNILKPILSPILQQSIFNERWVYNFDGIDDYIAIPTVSLAGDFEVNFPIAVTLNKFLYGGPDANNRAALIIAGEFQVWIAGTIIATSGAGLVDGQSVYLKVTRVGTAVSLFVDGVQLGAGVAAGAHVIETIAAQSTLLTNYQKVIRDFQVIDNGTLIRNYPINDNSDVIRDTVTVLGPELVTNGDFSNGTTGWTPGDSTLAVVNGELEITANASPGSARANQIINTTIGSQYLLTGKLRRGVTPNDVGLVVAAIGGVQTSSDENTTLSFLFEATGITEEIRCVVLGVTAAGETGFFDNISVRQADGYGTLVNGNPDRWEFKDVNTL